MWLIRLRPLRVKCPNTELFLVRIFLYSDWIRRDTKYFLAFGQNTERYKVSFRIQSECGKIGTKNNSVLGHFSRSGCYGIGKTKSFDGKLLNIKKLKPQIKACWYKKVSGFLFFKWAQKLLVKISLWDSRWS